MLITDKTYRINDIKAMSETLDGETIIINLENGNYYSMNITGSIVWNKIGSETSIKHIVKYLEDRYTESSENIEKSVLDLIEFLKNDELILESEENTALNFEYNLEPKEAFVIPSIERYEDMQEMLLADPIHDVEEEGWPSLKPVN